MARAYIRVSTEEQAASGYSLLAQRERLESFAASQGWSLARVYEDDGYSAKDVKRPALQAMLQESRAGEVILVYKLDRLTRSVLDLYALMKRFEERGLLFKSATEEFNTTTPHGRLMMTLVAVLAQWERETIAERVKMGRQKKASTGEWPGGPIPFGYLAESGRVKAGRQLIRLVPDPARAHLVRALFERYLAGTGLRKLALWLNDELGVRAPGGGRWRVNTVSKLLTNPVYGGEIVHGRRIAGPVTRVRGSHEPIVAPDLFEAVQRLFERRKGMPPRHATGTYPLAGVARCGGCGGAVSVHHARRGLYYYRCLNYVQGRGCGVPPLTSFPGPLAEGAVVDWLAGLEQPAGLTDFLQGCHREQSERPGFDQAEVRRLEAELAEARQAIARWNLAYESGRLEFEAYLARTRPHEERIREATERLTQAAPVPSLPARDLVRTLDFRAVWNLATPPERKSLLMVALRAFSATVVLDRGRQVRLAPPEG